MTQAAAKGAVVPAGQASFELPFVIDPSSDGGEWLHVYRSVEGTSVALRNPAGTIINAETAAGMGFAWLERTVAISANVDPDDGDGLGVELGGIGTHTIIEFSAGQPAGTHVLVFNAGSTTVETVVAIELWTNSPIAAGVRTDARSYRTGNTVTAVAVVANGGAPVASATVTGYVLPTRDVTESVVVGDPVLLDKSDLGSGMSHYRYRVRLQNNTQNSVWRFAAKAESFEEDVRVVRGLLGFPPMPPGTSLLSEDSISVIAPTTPEFNPSSLDWETTAKSAPISVVLTDVGPANGVAGDGVYGAVFQPVEPGEYSLSLDIAGATATGTPFYRNAATTFMLVQTQATVASITSTGVDANNNQKYEAIRFTASIDVQEPGEYTLSFQIKDSADHAYTFLRAAELNAGANQMLLDADAKHLLDAGFTSGPLSIIGVTLRREVFGRDTVVDYHETMGVTPSYNLGDFDRGSIYFTGQATEQALNLDGFAGYDVLRVLAEAVQGPGVAAGTMNCRVQAKLTDAAGFVIDAVTGSAAMSEGTNQVAIDFRGPKIARSNVNGPYAVRDVSLECSGMSDTAAALLTTTAYLAANFQNIAPEFVIEVSGISLKPGQTRAVPLTIRGIGAYEGTVTLSASTASPGLTPAVDYPEVLVDSLTTVKLTADADVTPGNYSMELSATDGPITRTRAVPVVVSTEDVDVEVTVTGPRYLHPGMSTRPTATVLNTTQQDVVWSIYPGTGSFVSSGDTATFCLDSL